MPFKNPDDRRRYDRERKRLLRAQEGALPVLAVPVRLKVAQDVEALLDEVREDPTQQISAGPDPIEFDDEGNLADLSHAPSTASMAPAQQPDAW